MRTLTRRAQLPGPRPQPPIFTIFRRGGLHCGRRTAPRRGLTAANRGELHYMRLRHAGDTPLEGFM